MKKKYYLVLDTETATLPICKQLAKTPKQMQQLAIAKPLVYDIGWCIVDRKGTIVKKVNYLIQETFFVPQIFNTAYYKEKRPLYMKMLEKNEIQVATWNQAINELLKDCQKVELLSAYNATFDFKKAIPFTERYIKALYSTHYNDYEERQKHSCYNILNGESSKNDKYLEPYAEIKGFEFDLVDLWGMATQKLINNNRYKDFCLKNKQLTNSGLYFKTSAETVFQYLIKDEDFIEDHTALSDAIIESHILTKILAKGKIVPNIQVFPFRELGETYKYVKRVKGKEKYKKVVVEKIENYLKENISVSPTYLSRLENILVYLEMNI